MSEAVGLALLGGGIAIASAIFRFVPQRTNGNYVISDVCSERHKALDEKLDAIRLDLKEIKQSIKNGVK